MMTTEQKSGNGDSARIEGVQVVIKANGQIISGCGCETFVLQIWAVDDEVLFECPECRVKQNFPKGFFGVSQ